MKAALRKSSSGDRVPAQGPHPRIIEAKLKQAEKAHEANRYYAAFKAYTWLVKKASDSEAAQTAAERLLEYEADEAIRQTIRAEQDAQDAKAILAMARNYESAGKSALAKENYQRILDKYPQVEDCCDQARNALAEMES